jgi:hypothetical protein
MGEPVLGEPTLGIHAYDCENQDKSSKDSSDEQETDPIDDEIRQSPVTISPTRAAAVTMSVMATTPVITVTGGRAESLPPAVGVTPTSIQNRMNAMLRHTGPPGGGGGPGGLGRPDSLGAPGRPHIPQQPVALAGDVKTMGQLPQIFTRDCAKADNFIEEVKGYLHLNQDVAGFNSLIKKIAFILMLIKGQDTAGWTHDMGNSLDRLGLADNIPDLWMQFLKEVGQQFQDTQKGNRAQAQLEGLRMWFSEINTYITKFEELVRQAEYTAGNPETMHAFIKGLAPTVMEDILKPPHIQMYHVVKQKAIECTRSRVLLDNILRVRLGYSIGLGQPMVNGQQV